MLVGCKCFATLHLHGEEGQVNVTKGTYRLSSRVEDLYFVSAPYMTVNNPFVARGMIIS